ncbi:reverse transcriptase domain-containing protein [Tanacetum coccineum]
MEEMLNKFVDEGKREYEEMRAFIYDFQTNNELLFKERNNSLISLRFGVQELLNVINNVLMIDYDVKGVTTRGGKTMTQDVHDNNTNVLPKEFLTNDQLNSSLMINRIPHLPTTEDDECYGIDDLDETINKEAQELLANEEPDSFLSRGLEKSINQSDLECCKPTSSNEKNRLIQKTQYGISTLPIRPSANEIDEKKPELKNLPQHLEYAYLYGDKSFPIIISSKLFEREKISLLQVLERRKRAIAWKMSDIKGTSPLYCTHKILMEDDYKLVIQPQRRLNPKKKAFNILKEKLTTAPIIISPDWNIPFELICDASDFAVGAILGQQIDGKFKPIYYARKTLNNAQEHYTTTEKELIAVVFSFDKFCQYLVLSKTVVYTDHSALKYLFSKEDAKPRLIRFGDHTEEEITDEFPDEHLMILKAELNNDEPWYVDYVNYIVEKIVPPNWTPEKRRRFFSQVKNYFWDEPYAFKLCLDNVIRRCVDGNEILEILGHCHSGPTGGHHSVSITGRKVYESGFYWPSIFKDAKDYVMRCDACQRSGNISSRSEMPQNNIQVGYNPNNWSEKLDDALWAFRTAYKTPTGCTPFRLVYGKACHLHVEIEHKAYWALKQ